MSSAVWTAADSAELDLLSFELGARFTEHRANCAACHPGRCCPTLAAYLEHRDTCRPCENAIKVSTATYGDPCPRYLAHLEHGQTCPRCNPCPALVKAISAVVDWREGRALRSTATWLRRQEFERERTPGRVRIAFDQRGEVTELEVAPADAEAA